MSMGVLIAQQAELWIDVPFQWQGRVRAGCDCKGLIAGVFAELGLAEADSVEALAGDYGDRVPVARLKAGLADLFDPIDPFGERYPGDILLCRMMGAAQHLAIAAALPGLPWRAIEALPSGPARVRPATRTPVRVDSIWRLKLVDRTNVRASRSQSSLPERGPPVSEAPEGLS